jgi:hypothetical protein
VADSIPGIDDYIAERAFARRGLERLVADGTLCGRLFTHPRQPTEFDALGVRAADTCMCLRLSGHDPRLPMRARRRASLPSHRASRA